MPKIVSSVLPIGVRHSIAERRNLALGGVLDHAERRGGRSHAGAGAEENGRVELEDVVPEQDGEQQRHRGRDGAPDEQAQADLLDASHEARAGVDPDDGDEDVEAQRVHQHEGRRGNAAEGRPDGAQVAEQQPGEERTARGREADRHAAPVHAEGADQPADQDAAGDGHQVGGLERTVGDAERVHRRVDVADAAGEREDVAAEDLRSPAGSASPPSAA